jgi:ATP-dependent phosphoenolpyruvate carboxykinase
MWERVKTSKTACWLLNASHMGAFGHGEIDCFPILRRVLDEIYPQSLEPQNLVADELWPFQRLASLSDMGPTQLDPRSAWQDKTQFTAQSRRLSRLLTAQISTYSEFLPNDICQSLALPNMDP